MDDQRHPFEQLSPMRIADAVESLGFCLSSEPFALNSYENRVFMLCDDERRRWVVKFYRPGRWRDEQIQEEHDFLTELSSDGAMVAAPWRDEKGRSLHHRAEFRLTMYPCLPGQAPELDNPAHLYALGEAIGQVHAVGRRKTFIHRPVLDLNRVTAASREAILSGSWLTRRQRPAYERISATLQKLLESRGWPVEASIRTHGDCHPGNLLGRDEQFALVDFDDCMMAPAVQDIWMLLSAQNDQEIRAQLSEILEGYEQYTAFPRQELEWIEPLRSLRLMRHTAWLIERWEDPAFPQAFPWVADEGYWDQHIRQLDQQCLVLDRKTRWIL
ncbi:serine/threonine protein kinase [Pistricoccus aurantiacus]|uniref:serine/threonine protein kinase n=1 Tax=Pistricoccus aurantiacus TaxID=1883414 RepID=UPI001FE2B683|nr:serine/threonine protein kinase [Pistricoccus aurantiacus]